MSTFAGGPDWSPRTEMKESEETRARDDSRVMAVIIDALAAHPAALDAVKRALWRERERNRGSG